SPCSRSSRPVGFYSSSCEFALRSNARRLARRRDGRDGRRCGEHSERTRDMVKSFVVGIAAASLLSMAAGAVTPRAAPSQSKDIVDTAVAAGSFKTLAAALAAADLV